MALFVGMLFVLLVIESDPAKEKQKLPQPSLNTLYLSMSTANKIPSNIYLITYFLRRAIYAIVVVLMGDHPALQLHILMFATTFTGIVLIRGRMYEDRIKRWMVLFYEGLFIVSCLLTLIFTTEYIYGNFQINRIIGITVCSLLLLVLIAGIAFTGYSIWWQISFNRRRFAKQIENAALYQQALT